VRITICLLVEQVSKRFQFTLTILGIVFLVELQNALVWFSTGCSHGVAIRYLYVSFHTLVLGTKQYILYFI